jgi:hypothetical protein
MTRRSGWYGPVGHPSENRSKETPRSSKFQSGEDFRESWKVQPPATHYESREDGTREEQSL